jgi:hypothetical protein
MCVDWMIPARFAGDQRLIARHLSMWGSHIARWYWQVAAIAVVALSRNQSIAVRAVTGVLPCLAWMTGGATVS